jgi:hypothetical protein
MTSKITLKDLILKGEGGITTGGSKQKWGTAEGITQW